MHDFLERHVTGFCFSRVLWVAGVALGLMVVLDQMIDGRARWEAVAVGSVCDCQDCLMHHPRWLRLQGGYPAYETTHLFDANTGVHGPVVMFIAATGLMVAGWSRGRSSKRHAARRNAMSTPPG